jgi:hypothetical protein
MARQRASQARAAFARVGTAPATPAGPAEPATDGERNGAETPRARDVTASRRRGAPSVAGAVAFTVRFDPDEALQDDELVLALRRELRRSRLDKAEVVRTLLRAARSREDVRQALLEELLTP